MVTSGCFILQIFLFFCGRGSQAGLFKFAQAIKSRCTYLLTKKEKNINTKKYLDKQPPLPLVTLFNGVVNQARALSKARQ